MSIKLISAEAVGPTMKSMIFKIFKFKKASAFVYYNNCSLTSDNVNETAVPSQPMSTSTLWLRIKIVSAETVHPY